MIVHDLSGVHERAEIGECTIGRGSRVWQFASVIRGAQIGNDCNVASGACIDGARIGNGCIIGHNVLVPPGAWLGDGVFVGPNAVICNDAWPRAHKEGFDLSKFDGETRFAVTIGDGASIGALALVLPGVRIGDGAMVAGRAVVTRDVPAGWLYVGKNDMRPIGEERDRLRMRFAFNNHWDERAA